MNDFIKRLSKPDTRSFLAVLALLGGFSFVGLLFFKAVPKENVALLNTLLPMVLTGTTFMACGFYYNASKTDKKLDDVK